MKKSGTDSAQKKGIEFKADTRMNLTVGKSEYENYTDENFELLGRVYKNSLNIFKMIDNKPINDFAY